MRLLVHVATTLTYALMMVLLGFNAGLTWHAYQVRGDTDPIIPFGVITVFALAANVSLYKSNYLFLPRKQQVFSRFHRPKRKVERASSRFSIETGKHAWALHLECNHVVFLRNHSHRRYPIEVKCPHCRRW